MDFKVKDFYVSYCSRRRNGEVSGMAGTGAGTLRPVNSMAGFGSPAPAAFPHSLGGTNKAGTSH